MSVETFKHNGFTITIEYDDNREESPREWDNFGLFLACNHKRYTLGDDENVDHYAEVERAFQHFAERGILHAFPRWARVFLGSSCILPVYLYDHSGLSVRAGKGFGDVDPHGWDWGILGFILDTEDRRKECGIEADKVEAALRGEIETYNQYLTGDVYGYTIEDVNGDEVDSCWGLYGLDYAREAAREAATGEQPERLYNVRLTPEQLVTIGSERTYGERVTAETLNRLGIDIPADDDED